MPSITVRDVPGEVLDRIRMLSERDRRSMNKEILVILEEGVATHGVETNRGRPPPGMSADLQLRLWRNVAGKWEDERSTREIVSDIRRARTGGREVRL